MATKTAKDLEPGDRVMMDEQATRTVSAIHRGFARFDDGNGGSERGVFIDWRDGDWSQVSGSQVFVLAAQPLSGP